MGPNRVELVGYLNEALPLDAMARIEENLRKDPAWRQALAELSQDLDLGEHTVATIWRRHRLTCSSREYLATYLTTGLPPNEQEFVKFHLEVLQCRWCLANLSDLQETLVTYVRTPAETKSRRRRFFETSVGCLARKKS